MSAFDEFARGDRIRFATVAAPRAGRTIPRRIWRRGTVLLATSQALTIWCDPNPLGRRALLRRSEWDQRQPEKL